jgi:hypothetical protein
LEPVEGAVADGGDSVFVAFSFSDLVEAEGLLGEPLFRAWDQRRNKVSVWQLLLSEASS